MLSCCKAVLRPPTFFALLGLTALPLAAAAAETDAAPESVAEPAAQTEEVAAEEPAPMPLPTPSKLTIHGFFSQAYAEASDRPILGIPIDGTFDYRTAALQIRYEATDDHSFLLQLDHERLGSSPYAGTRDDVEVDWLYYQFDFGGRNRVRVGKFPMPYGIYSEIRDVGTLLPFYRPPEALYGEGGFANETIDGVGVSFGTSADAAWSLDVDVFGGQWTSYDQNVTKQESKDAIGVALWVNTPVEGLRFGVAGRTYEQHDVGSTSPANELDDLLYSLEGAFSRFTIRGELQDIDWGSGGSQAWYAQAIIRLTRKLSLNLQVQEWDIEVTVPVGPPGPFGPPLARLPFDIMDDVTVGLSYAIRTDLVIKVEAHDAEGLTADDLTFEEFLANEPIETRYAIASLSFSF